MLSNIIANQTVHEKYGGVVPELASRAHMQHIVPVVKQALDEAGVKMEEISAVSFTQAPGLIGSLLVGSQFAKSMALALDKPLIAVHHMQAHVMANLIGTNKPQFPFLCLTVSGGHTQIVQVDSPSTMKVIGETLDDAAGEAFDKTAKLLGLPYPGGPLIDKYARDGDPHKFSFAEPRIDGLDFSFSGLKTSVLYFLQKEIKNDPDFVSKNLADICASIQQRIISILLNKLKKAALQTGCKHLCIAGGVSANKKLRQDLEIALAKIHAKVFYARHEFCTDNGAMIAYAGCQRLLAGQSESLAVNVRARWPLNTLSPLSSD